MHGKCCISQKYWRLFLLLQPKDMQYHCDRDPLSWVNGLHMWEKWLSHFHKCDKQKSSQNIFNLSSVYGTDSTFLLNNWIIIYYHHRPTKHRMCLTYPFASDEMWVPIKWKLQLLIQLILWQTTKHSHVLYPAWLQRKKQKNT